MTRNDAGPNVELWKAAVCTKWYPLPPLQNGEHMTVGQVRHPALQTAFAAEFENWFITTKAKVGKWRAKKKLDSPALPHLLKLANSGSVSAEMEDRLIGKLAKRLEWDAVTYRQLQALLNSTELPERALRLLLKKSQQSPEKAQAEQAQDGGSSGDDADSDGDEDAAWQQEHNWLALPQDMHVYCVNKQHVPDDDPRVVLRGQKGIWARRDLPAGYLLGPYRHYCLYSRSYEMLLTRPPKSWPDTPSSWRQCLESYACNDESQTAGVLEAKEPGKGYAAAGKYSLTFSGWGYGNLTAYANDPHEDPLNNMLLPNKPDDYLGPYIKGPDGKEVENSVQIFVISICGWPYVFMGTTRPVPEDTELLYDYGHSYWTLVAKAMDDHNKDKKLLEQGELLQRMRAQSAVTSGLTTSINLTAGIPGTTQEPSVAGAHQMQMAGTAAAAAAGSGKPQSSVGVSSMRHQLQDMQIDLQQQQQQQQEQEQQHEQAVQRRDDVQRPLPPPQPPPPPPQQQQQQQQQQEQYDEELSEGQLVAESGAGSMGSAAEEAAEEEDDASSTLPLSVLAQHTLKLDEAQRQKLLQVLNRVKSKQEQQQKTTVTTDNNKQQDVQLVDDPDVVKLIKDAQMKLSEALLPHPLGIRFKKIKKDWWWDKLNDYFGGRWNFITRHSQMFRLDSDIFSPNTKLFLTDEWKEVLVARMRREGRLPPHLDTRATQEGQQQQQQYAGSKRQCTIERVVRDTAREDALEQELQQVKQQLQELRAESQQDWLEVAARAHCDSELLLQLAQEAGAVVPPDLLERHQQLQLQLQDVLSDRGWEDGWHEEHGMSSARPPRQQNGSMAAPAAAPAAAVTAAADRFDLRSAPGGFSDDDSSEVSDSPMPDAAESADDSGDDASPPAQGAHMAAAGRDTWREGAGRNGGRRGGQQQQGRGRGGGGGGAAAAADGRQEWHSRGRGRRGGLEGWGRGQRDSRAQGAPGGRGAGGRAPPPMHGGRQQQQQWGGGGGGGGGGAGAAERQPWAPRGYGPGGSSSRQHGNMGGPHYQQQQQQQQQWGHQPGRPGVQRS